MRKKTRLSILMLGVSLFLLTGMMGDCGMFPAGFPATWPDQACDLVEYTASNFKGAYTNQSGYAERHVIKVDPLFVPALDRINTYAIANDVTVLVTSSFRSVPVEAQRSNHLIGHAIDMNVYYDDSAGQQKLCKESCLQDGAESTTLLPPGVAGFIQAIIDDPGLRWGGRFSPVDPVHIDDNTNNLDRSLWDQRYSVLREDGCGDDDSADDESAEDESGGDTGGGPSGGTGSGSGGSSGEGSGGGSGDSPPWMYDDPDDPCAVNGDYTCNRPNGTMFCSPVPCDQVCPPPGYVQCTCPDQHMSLPSTCWFGSALYHPNNLYCD